MEDNKTLAIPKHVMGIDLQQEADNLTGIIGYMENINARQFDPSRVVLLVALVRDRILAAIAAESRNDD